MLFSGRCNCICGYSNVPGWNFFLFRCVLPLFLTALSPPLLLCEPDVNFVVIVLIVLWPSYGFLCRQQALFHVLAAYSMYNTEVGYCQGMSQIAAIFLMYMNEEVGNSFASVSNSFFHRTRLLWRHWQTFETVQTTASFSTSASSIHL